ncbi:hypothetical protein [Flavobacterium hydrophilum]|uniref:Uncharacterized protein n=1 Tax=Flavobacterium hydrophilum TaxID=2211445 RepID=A0A2V4C0V8_9FLAO|nr:hypothetical protein [Flavobacterium hydrophilum]PXY44502.1 hypothetical protein DMB68_13625 [Flavobacterium hydrophilum]
MELLTTYRAQGKEIGLVFLFKYDLNGNLKLFEVSEGELNQTQIEWLFSSNFPAQEITIKTVWMVKEKYTKVFEIKISPADLSFNSGWLLYNHKLSKLDAEKAFKKMTEAETILFFLSLPGYERYLKRSGIAKANMATYINKKYYHNEYPEEIKTKNFNPIIADFAKRKTERR